MKWNSPKAKAMMRSHQTVFGGPLQGYDVYGATTKATLFIGRSVGLDTGRYPEGSTIPKNAAVDVVMGLRAQQIGREAAMTVASTEGFYKGTKEPSLQVDVAFVPLDREKSQAAFQRNIKSLAQEAAHVLGQREILIQWVENGRKTTTATASPTKAPSPMAQAFCGWVRQHSASARTNRSDPCYRPTATAKPRRRAKPRKR